MENSLNIFKITIDPEYSENGEDLGIDQIAFTSNPAIMVKGMAFQSQKVIMSKDDSKMRIAAPALIPMNIYRNDDLGEYYVQFTKEEIEKIFVKFMSQLNNTGKFNEEHDTSKTVPAFILEAWLVGKDNKQDRSYSEFGIEVPEGTMFIVAQLTNKDYYTNLVKNNQVGFSIEGFLGMKLSQHECEYPMQATINARRALKYKEENKITCGNESNWSRTRLIANRQPLDDRTIFKMASYRRQKRYKDISYKDGCGGIMWDAWGGDEGINWATDKVIQLKNSYKNKLKTKMKNKKRFSALKLAEGKLVEGGELTLIAVELMPEIPVIVIDEMLEIIEDYTGEIEVDGKTVIIENGFIIEVIEKEVIEEEITIEEEVELTETKLQVNQDEVIAIIQPKLDEIYKLIADLQIAIDELKPKEEIIKEEIAMNLHQRFSNALSFLSEKKK